jgi:uncharacterized protein (TIGR02271 family)
MIRKQDANQLPGAKVLDREGQRIGAVGQVYLDESTGEPAWVAVHTGMFGTKENFVPLDQSTRLDNQTLRVSVTKAAAQDAPHVEPDTGRLSERSAAELYRYYNMPLDVRSGTGTTRGDEAANRRIAPARDESGRSPNLTLYEEQMRVGKQRVESGRVKLRKHVVTEEVGTTVPLEHEDVRVVREPFRGAADRDHHFGDEEVDVTLYEEEPVVSKESTPRETVGLAKQTRTDQRQVKGTTRKERVDVDNRPASSRATGRADVDQRQSQNRTP